MIVQCDQCQARFRLADEKVTDKGVRVRCAKCQHTFRVTRAGAGQAPAVPAPPALARPAPAPPALDPERTTVMAEGLRADLRQASEDRPPPAVPRLAAAPPPPAMPRVAPPPLPPAATPRAPARDAAMEDLFAFGASEAPAPAGPPPTQSGPTRVADYRALFGTTAQAPLGAPPSAAPAAPDEDVRALFDLPARPAPAAALAQPAPPAPAPLPIPAPSPFVPEPEPEGPPLGRRTLALGVHLGVAAAGLLVLALAARALAQDAPADGLLARWLAPPAALEVRGLVQGLYDTRGPRPALLVSGEVARRGEAAGRVRVRAVLWDGEQQVQAVEGLAGAVAGPEALAVLAGPEDARALQARLDQGARPLAPGAQLPFLLVFPEPPSSLAGLRLEVSAEEAPAGARPAVRPAAGPAARPAARKDG